MLYLLIFIIGLVFGSFYTVVGLRLPINKSILFPGSHCPNCKHQLKWYELIPVISFIIQKGKCRSCKEKMSIMYPIMEILTGVLFVACYHIFGLDYRFFIGIITASLTIIIFVSDVKYYIILDSPLIIATILVIGLKLYFVGITYTLIAILTGIILFTFMLLTKLLGDKLFKKESLGGGDIKLAFYIGLLLALTSEYVSFMDTILISISLSLLSLVLGSILALPYTIYAMIKEKENLIPFGPFLALGMLIIFLFTDRIVEFLPTVL